ncbi:MAG: zinc-binding protein [Dehalococcoidia bacterium]|nr:zinc-binding protein [Dehalococcoidia bacterium]
MTCRDCGDTFTFSAGEQEFYASKGLLNEPRRCTNCRATRRSGGGESYGMGGEGRSNREMFDVICDDCGKDTKVPFMPRGDRPVYCSDCFAKTRSN